MPATLRELTITVPKELFDKLDGLFDEGVKEQFIPSTAEHSDMYNAAFLMGIQQMALEIAHRKMSSSAIVIPGGGDVNAKLKEISAYNSRIREDKPQIIQ